MEGQREEKHNKLIFPSLHQNKRKITFLFYLISFRFFGLCNKKIHLLVNYEWNYCWAAQ